MEGLERINNGECEPMTPRSRSTNLPPHRWLFGTKRRTRKVNEWGKPRPNSLTFVGKKIPFYRAKGNLPFRPKKCTSRVSG